MTRTGGGVREGVRLVTAAALSAWLQSPISRVREAMRAIGARPAVTINGLEHYDEDEVVDLVREWLADKAR